MKRAAIVSALLLAGCSNAEDKAQALQEIMDKCEGRATLTAYTGSWGSGVEVRCVWDASKEVTAQ
jgi:uncharacterized lipoprotein YmbA